MADLPPCPEVVRAAEERGIRDIVHFTTVSGAVGVLAGGFSEEPRATAARDVSRARLSPQCRCPQGSGMAGLREPLDSPHQRLDVRHFRPLAHKERESVGRSRLRSKAPRGPGRRLRHDEQHLPGVPAAPRGSKGSGICSRTRLSGERGRLRYGTTARANRRTGPQTARRRCSIRARCRASTCVESMFRERIR